MSCSVGLRRSDSVVLGTCRRRESRELREKVLWTSRARSVSQGTYLLFDLPYTCRLSEDTAVLVVASSVLLLLGNTWNVMWTPCKRLVNTPCERLFPPKKCLKGRLQGVLTMAYYEATTWTNKTRMTQSGISIAYQFMTYCTRRWSYHIIMHMQRLLVCFLLISR